MPFSSHSLFPSTFYPRLPTDIFFHCGLSHLCFRYPLGLLIITRICIIPRNELLLRILYVLPQFNHFLNQLFDEFVIQGIQPIATHRVLFLTVIPGTRSTFISAACHLLELSPH